MKALVPIFAFAVAIALFFVYIQPTFGEIRMLQSESSEYQEAIDKAEQLQLRVQELIAERNNISLTDLERLEAMLPDTLDEIALLIDIQALAETHSMALGSIEIQSGEGGSSESIHMQLADDPRSDSSEPDMPYKTLDIVFTLTGSYDEFRNFLGDLERSLVLGEVMELSFDTTEDGTVVVHNLTVRFYALNRAL